MQMGRRGNDHRVHINAKERGEVRAWASLGAAHCLVRRLRRHVKHCCQLRRGIFSDGLDSQLPDDARADNAYFHAECT